MRKTILLQSIIVVLIATLLIILDVSYFNVFTHKIATSGSKVIIIDAGHGGMDGGAVGRNGTVEKDINLAISKKLKGYIEDHGDTSIMIREVDEGLYGEYGTVRNKKNEDLKNRKQIIKEHNADIFVSIHLNFFPQSQYYGAQVFYEKESEKSKRLAKLTQEELVKILDRNNKRVEKPSSTYYMLNGNDIPSIIVECGFLSNPEEESLLKNEDYQNKIAFAIYSGIMRYFTEPEVKE